MCDNKNIDVKHSKLEQKPSYDGPPDYNGSFVTVCNSSSIGNHVALVEMSESNYFMTKYLKDDCNLAFVKTSIMSSRINSVDMSTAAKGLFSNPHGPLYVFSYIGFSSVTDGSLENPIPYNPTRLFQLWSTSLASKNEKNHVVFFVDTSSAKTWIEHLQKFCALAAEPGDVRSRMHIQTSCGFTEKYDRGFAQPWIAYANGKISQEELVSNVSEMTETFGYDFDLDKKKTKHTGPNAWCSESDPKDISSVLDYNRWTILKPLFPKKKTTPKLSCKESPTVHIPTFKVFDDSEKLKVSKKTKKHSRLVRCCSF